VIALVAVQKEDCYYAPARREGAISVAFVCPSVANNSRTQRPIVPKFGRKVPHLWCDSHTSFNVKKSKVKVTKPINAHTSCPISSERQGLRTSNLVYGWRTTTHISQRRHDLQGQRSKVKVARSRDQSEPFWPTAVPVSLEAGGAYRVGRTLWLQFCCVVRRSRRSSRWKLRWRSSRLDCFVTSRSAGTALTCSLSASVLLNSVSPATKHSPFCAHSDWFVRVIQSDSFGVHDITQDVVSRRDFLTHSRLHFSLWIPGLFYEHFWNCKSSKQKPDSKSKEEFDSIKCL